MRPVLRALAGAVALAGTAAVGLTGAIGVAHTPSGAFLLPYLAQLPGMGGLCPLGFASDLAPLDRDAARASILAPEATSRPAASRPAMGFVLQRTTRTDVAAWSAGLGVACEATKIADLRCADVPAAALGRPVGTWSVLFRFDAEGRLVAVDADARAADAAEAVVLYNAASDALSAAGPPSDRRGTPDAAWLARGALNQATARYRFADYRADLTATNLGKRGLVVHESVQSL